MSKRQTNYQNSKASVQALESESKTRKLSEVKLMNKQSVLREQNIKLAKKSIELSDIKRELEDKNVELQRIRSELKKQNIDLVRKSIELSDAMRQLEDKNFDLELSRSDLEKTLSALRQSEDKYRQLIENASEAIFVAQDGILKFVNPSTIKIIGYSERELTSKPFTEFIHPQDRNMVVNRHQKRLQGKEVMPSYSFRIVTKKRDIKWVLLTAVKIHWEGRPATLTFLNDITEQKHAEFLQNVIYEISNAVSTTEDLQMLLQSIKYHLSKIIDTTNFFIALYDKNKDALSLPFFVDEKDSFTTFPAGKTLTAYVIRNDKPLLAHIEDIRQLEKQGEVEIVGTPAKVWLGVPLKTGRKVIGAVVVQSYTNDSLYANEDLEILKFVSHQIALAIERKRAEEHLKESLHEKEKLLQELERSNTELKEFAYIVSHDLKAPLRAIGSLSEWIVMDYGDKLGEEGKEQLHLLANRVKRMHDLIESILEYSKVGRNEEKKITVDLNQLVYEVIDNIAPPKNIKIKIRDKLPVLVGERTRLKQVFQNLISNAVKYMDKPQGRIEIGCESNNGCWKFSVADNGPGIDAKYHNKIFQIFQTLTPRDDCESTGIGLTLVKKILETNGGSVWVESKIGKGSKFHFSLPKLLHKK